MASAISHFKRQVVVPPLKFIEKCAVAENWTKADKDIEIKKSIHSLKLQKIRLEAKMELQLAGALSQLNRHKESINHSKLAVTCCHNLITETSLLCKLLSKKQLTSRNLLNQKKTGLINKSNFLSPTSKEFMYATLSKLHTFNMKEIDFENTATDTQDVLSKQTYYFHDNLKALDRVITIHEPILNALMKKISVTENRIRSFMLSPVQTLLFLLTKNEGGEIIKSPEKTKLTREKIEEMKRNKELKIKARSLIGLKSKQDWVYNIQISDLLKVNPLSMNDLVPDEHIARELRRDSIYEKVILLVASYFTLAKEYKELYESDKMDVNVKEAKYWQEMAIEIACSFLPSDVPIVDHVIYSMCDSQEVSNVLKSICSNKEQSPTKRDKHSGPKPGGENRINLTAKLPLTGRNLLTKANSGHNLLIKAKETSKGGKTSALGFVSPKMKPGDARDAKVHTAMGIGYSRDNKLTTHIGQNAVIARPKSGKNSNISGTRPMRYLIKGP